MPSRGRFRVRLWIALIASIGAVATSSLAQAQGVFVGGALEYSLEHFDDRTDFNRLNGSAPGLSVVAGMRGGAFEARLEGFQNASMEDTETTSVTFGGRTAQVRSSLSHRARALSAIGGYRHHFSPRVQFVGLGGLTYVSVRRTFTTNAGQILLAPPSTIPAGPISTVADDSFASWTVGADGFFRLSNRVQLFAGVRGEPLRLSDEVSGRSVRMLAGAVWTLR